MKFRDRLLVRGRSAAMAVLPPKAAIAALAWSKWYAGEREMRLLPLLCDRDLTSVDVGANAGVYTWHLRRLTRVVHAYEPIPELAACLRSNLPGCVVHECALSSEVGTALLRIPIYAGSQVGALASLSHDFDGAESIREIEVPMRRLDDEGLDRLGFIKVDAEGHERRVLAGAKEILARDHPTLLVEIEERHAPGAIDGVVGDLAALGYGAYFLGEDGLRPISEFDRDKMQDATMMGADGWATGTYINNFVFLPRTAAWPGQCRLLGGRD